MTIAFGVLEARGETAAATTATMAEDQTVESPLIGTRKEANASPTPTLAENQRLINRRARFTVAICACGMAVLAFVFVMRKSRYPPPTHQTPKPQTPHTLPPLT